jgi:hypothetical protein
MTGGRPNLVVAHPGHELRLFGWIKEQKPIVHILTKGSRNGTCGRIEASAAVLERLGAGAGNLFGAIYDRDLYAFLLSGETDIFHEWTDRLRDSFLADKPSFVVVDAWQLYNVAHDLIHVMARIAAAEASAQNKKSISVFDYPVVPAALEGKVPASFIQEEHNLDFDTLQQKMIMARAFPDIGNELEEIAALEGAAALAQETLRVPPPLALLRAEPSIKPAYETYGEERVKAGLYADIIRWRHVAPVADSLMARIPQSQELERA